MSLLTTDYNNVTKAVAIRLQKVIPDIIDADQVGYIKNRYIGQNIRIIYDILSHAKENEIDAFLVLVIILLNGYQYYIRISKHALEITVITPAISNSPDPFGRAVQFPRCCFY